MKWPKFFFFAALFPIALPNTNRKAWIGAKAAVAVVRVENMTWKRTMITGGDQSGYDKV